MRLHEYQSKALFAEHGIPIPQGDVAATPTEARRLAEHIGGAVAVKAQVLVGGRGKAGGVRLANSPTAAEEAAAALLDMQISGLSVRQVLVEEAVDIRQEIYLGIVIDRVVRRAVMIASAEGGMEIERVARDHPEAIAKVVIEPTLGLTHAQALDLAAGAGFVQGEVERRRAFADQAYRLLEAFLAYDALLAEINPLVVTSEGKLLSLDAKMVIDDSALFRHPHLKQMWTGVPPAAGGETAAERQAREAGLSYVYLGGNIGCVVNGAGLAMAAVDVIELFGGAPANFLDVGGGADAERVAAALRLVLNTPGIDAVLVNIFGGITHCDDVARGVVAALEDIECRVPLIARLAGTNEEQGGRILRAGCPLGYRLVVANTLADAAREAVAAAGGGPVT
jgi:succinyl-CoA synthetase beta subunit